MKIHLFYLLVLLSVGFISCKKDSADGNNDDDEITVDIDGSHWESATTSNFLQKLTPANNPPHTQISISGYTADNHSTINFTITDYKDRAQGDCLRLTTFLPPGSATDTVVWMGVPLKCVATLQYVVGNTSYTTLNNGELTISSCNATDRTINGTFSFVGVSNGGDTLRFTNGKFNNMKFSRL